MDLLEYQAKELFREMEIPVLPSQRIDHPKDLKTLKLPYPIVLKSQVHRGGRSRAGGIKFVTNTIDAVAAAQAIFNLSILGEYPQVLLAEAKYDVNQEFYLAIALDSSARRPVLLGSPEGGIAVESAMEQMQQVVVDQEFSPFYARRLALKMGLTGPLVCSVSEVIEKMYKLFLQKDLDSIEINPLGISPNGEVMALDGKVTVNNGAIGRHPDLMHLVRHSPLLAASIPGYTNAAHPNQPQTKPTHPLADSPHLVTLEGNIGILCNGAGLTMTTLDLVYQGGGKPANFLNIGSELHCTWPSASLQERMKQGLELVSADPKVKVALVNVLGTVASGEELTQSLLEFIQSRLKAGPRAGKGSSPLPQLIMRLVGQQLDVVREQLAEFQVFVTDSLDEAVAQSIRVAKLR